MVNIYDLDKQRDKNLVFLKIGYAKRIEPFVPEEKYLDLYLSNILLTAL